jgi:S-adenosylmethionine-dependent methyltransferase
VPSTAWDPVAAEFVDQYSTLYGRVRTHVVDAHLREHLPPPPARVIDVGGGAGHQALPLARRGYVVTVLDPSRPMLDAAARTLALEDPGVAARVALVEGRGESAATLVDRSAWDGVLCHGVVPYLEEPEPLLRSLCDLARPGGVVSIVAKNACTLAVRPALDGDWAGALAAFDAERQVNGLGLDTRGDTVEGLGVELARFGAEAIAWYGVRLFSERWARDRSADDDVDDVLAVELEASRRDPYRQMSRLFHLLARRR